jgi:hypothetical protein
VSGASRRQKDINGAVAALGTASGNIVGVAAGVRDLDAVEHALNSANSQLGTIDVLVYAAAGNWAAVNARSSNGFLARGGHRPDRHLPCHPRGLPAPDQARRHGHQHIRAAVVHPDAMPGRRLRRQGRPTPRCTSRPRRASNGTPT